MLREIANVRQIPDEPRRRWFTDEDLDLVVWDDASQRIVGFQLCYGKQTDERAVTWKFESGFSHSAVDAGEGRPGRYKATPILTEDDGFDADAVVTRFLDARGALDTASADFIHRKLLECVAR